MYDRRTWARFEETQNIANHPTYIRFMRVVEPGLEDMVSSCTIFDLGSLFVAATYSPAWALQTTGRVLRCKSR